MEKAQTATVYTVQEDTLSFYQPWEAIVEECSRCALTVSGDELVALSEAAMEMQTPLNDTYLADVWRSSCCRGMFLNGKNSPTPSELSHTEYHPGAGCLSTVTQSLSVHQLLLVTLLTF